MKQTTNYSLNKIELADSPPDITVLNPNFDKIDTELKNLSDGKAPNTHVTTSATSSVLGHVKLSDSVSSTSSTSDGVAATPNAVKTAYDKAVAVETALGTHDDVKGTSSVLGHVKLSDSTSSTSGASSGVAATPTAVKSAYDLANGKLSKSGDTMTGNLTMGADTRIEGATTNNRLFLAASPSAPLGGATLQLCGEDHPQPGVFYLYANENNEQQFLIGKPNGEFKWNDKHIVRSINNNAADANGNINVSLFSGNYNDLTNKPSLNYLPLSGGKMTAATAMTRNVDSDALQLHGGTSSANGAGIWLYGKDTSNLNGTFRIRATASGENIDLIGHKNGTLTWSGKNIVRSVNGTAADAAGNVTISAVTTATQATTVPNVVVGSIPANGTFTLPSGGTWRWIVAASYGEEGRTAGTSAGGSVITGSSNRKSAWIAIRVA